MTGSSGISACGSLLEGLEDMWREDDDLCSLLDPGVHLLSASTSASSSADRGSAGEVV